MSRTLSLFLALVLPSVLLAVAMPVAALDRLSRPLSLVTAAVTCFMLLALFHGGQGTYGQPQGAYFDDIGGAGHLAVGTAMAAAVAVHFVHASDTRRGLAWAFHVAVVGASFSLMVLSGSRSAVLVSLVCCILHLWLRWRGRSRGYLRTAMIVLIGLVVFYYALFIKSASPLSGIGRLRNLFSGDDQSAQAHVDYFHSALQDFLAHPILGNGVGSFGQSQGTYSYPHNLILEVANDFGVAGLCVLLALGWASCARMVRALKYGTLGMQCLALLFLTTLLQLMTGGSYSASGSLWLMGGVVFMKLPPGRSSRISRLEATHDPPVPVVESSSSVIDR